MRKLFCVFLAVGLAGAVAGCTGDDNQTNPSSDGGGTDGGGRDANQPDGNQQQDGSLVDGGDAGPCDFAAYVTDLIKNQTKDNTSPTTDLGQNCVDKQDQAQFKPLFP